MKYRNIQVAKMTGVKILAGLLVFGLTFSAPATAWAAEGGLTEAVSYTHLDVYKRQEQERLTFLLASVSLTICFPALQDMDFLI